MKNLHHDQLLEENLVNLQNLCRVFKIDYKKLEARIIEETASDTGSITHVVSKYVAQLVTTGRLDV